MKDHVVLNITSGQAFGPFDANEAGEFASIWGNIIPGLIVLPMNYKPVTQEQAQFVADSMSRN